MLKRQIANKDRSSRFIAQQRLHNDHHTRQQNYDVAGGQQQLLVKIIVVALAGGCDVSKLDMKPLKVRCAWSLLTFESLMQIWVIQRMGMRGSFVQTSQRGKQLR